MKISSVTTALILISAVVATPADQPTVRAALNPAGARQSAPAFALKDAAGKTVKLQDYRGKVVLLDFWATWCTGCKKELPMFSELQKTYGAKGLAVVGVSLDEGGWSVLRPFVEHANVSYPMVLGDDSTARKYGIETMPDTFLIDRKGRLAAAYRAGIVNQEDIEANIKTLLAKRQDRLK
jgi:peroxiredoxin